MMLYGNVSYAIWLQFCADELPVSSEASTKWLRRRGTSRSQAVSVINVVRKLCANFLHPLSDRARLFSRCECRRHLYRFRPRNNKAPAAMPRPNTIASDSAGRARTVSAILPE